MKAPSLLEDFDITLVVGALVIGGILYWVYTEISQEIADLESEAQQALTTVEGLPSSIWAKITSYF